MRWLLGFTLCAQGCFSEASDQGSMDPGPGSESASSGDGGTGTSAGTSVGASTDVSTSTSAEVTGMTDGPPNCGPGEAELPPAPDGWEGPVAVRTFVGEIIAECPPELTEAQRGYTNGGVTSCGCACQGAPDELCTISVNSGFDCMTPAEIDGPCVSLNAGQYEFVGIEPKACDPPAGRALVPPDSNGLLACGGLPPPEGQCVVLPPLFEDLCVFGPPGECPPEFPDPTTITQSQCLECEANCMPTDYCNSVVATGWSMQGCQGVSGPESPPGSACQSGDGYGSAGFTNDAQDAACPPVAATTMMLQLCCA